MSRFSQGNVTIDLFPAQNGIIKAMLLVERQLPNGNYQEDKIIVDPAVLDDLIGVLSDARTYLDEHCRSAGSHCGDFVGWREKP